MTGQKDRQVSAEKHLSKINMAARLRFVQFQLNEPHEIQNTAADQQHSVTKQKSIQVQNLNLTEILRWDHQRAEQ